MRDMKWDTHEPEGTLRYDRDHDRRDDRNFHRTTSPRVLRVSDRKWLSKTSSLIDRVSRTKHDSER